MLDIVDDFTVAESVVERWDREWARYFLTEDVAPHVIPERELRPAASIAGLSAEAVYHSAVADHPAFVRARPLHIWAPGDAIVGRRVAEIGCGTGFLARQIGRIVANYVGIDVSRLAIAVASGCAGDRCRFLHVNDTAALVREAGERDVVVAREFFIHQRYDDAARVLRLARFLLRPGGRVYADFFHRTEALDPEAHVHGAHTCVTDIPPSAGYHYEPQEIDELAAEAGFDLVSTTCRPELFRTFACLRRR